MQNIKTLIILLVLGCCTNSYAFSLKTLNHDLSRLIVQIQQKSGVPAISVSIILPRSIYPLNFVAGTKFLGGSPAIIDSDLFQIGSITKSFNAAAILLLESEGKLTLSDKLSRWFPEYPKWHDVTVLELLNNTSGIYNYLEDEVFVDEVIRLRQSAYIWSPRQVLDLAYTHPNDFLAGHGWHYSNTGWVMSGEIVRRITKKSLFTFLSEHFLGQENYNLLNTYVGPQTEPPAIKERLVHGYNQRGEDMTDINLSYAQNAGAIETSAEDLARWAYLLFHAKVIPEFQLHKMMQSVSVKTGEPVKKNALSGYGLGIGFKTSPYGKWWGHEGTTLGYSALIVYYPEYNITFSIIVNQLGKVSLADIANQIMQVLKMQGVLRWKMNK